jgi:hypothetical protein
MSYNPWDFLGDPQQQTQQDYTPPAPDPVYQYPTAPGVSASDQWNYDWYGTPLPQQQPDYSQQQQAQPAASADPWSFDYSQTPPPYQPQTPYQVPQPDIWSTLNSVVGNAAQGAADSNGYFGDVANALAAPWQAPDKQGMNPFEWVGDNLNRVAGSARGGLGAAVQPAGGGVDFLADNNIPVVSGAASGVRNAWEQFVEPAGNFVTSMYGALSDGGNPLNLAHGAGPAGAVIGGAFDLLQGRDPLQYYRNVEQKNPAVSLARENYFAEQHLADAEAALPDTVDPAQRPYVARTEVFENPASEFYWEKVGIDPQVAEGAQYMLQAERQAAAEAAPDAAFQPGETRIADTQSDFARQVQDTNQHPDPRLYRKTPSLYRTRGPYPHEGNRPKQQRQRPPAYPVSLTSSFPKAPGGQRWKPSVRRWKSPTT